MQLKNQLLIIFWILISLPAYSQSDERKVVVLEGDEAISLPDSIQQTIKIDSTKAVLILKKWYSARGFLNADIDSTGPLNYQVRRNCRFKLSELIIHYSGEIDSSVTETNLGEYSQNELEHKIKRLISDLEENGYAFARSKISAFNIITSACEVRAELQIETGKQLQTAEIYFSGADSNSQEYLRRISGYSETSTINRDYFTEIKSNEQ